MSGLEDLYREIILDHYRSPRHRGELPVPPAVRAEGFNPLCGDEVVVYLELDDPAKGSDAVVTDIKIDGQGCSISQSSASMMSAAVLGKTRGEIEAITRSFKAMMSIHEESLGESVGSADGASSDEGAAGDPSDAASLGDLEALRGVVKFPVRIKCATLPWNTLAEGFTSAQG